MGTKHTPGPWTIDEDGDGKRNAIVTSTHGDTSDDDVCEVYGGNCDDDEKRAANAALIAAAPDLLDACKAALCVLAVGCVCDGGIACLCCTLNKAITKAEGDEHQLHRAT